MSFEIFFHQEQEFVLITRPALKYLNLYEIAVISTLNKKLINFISKNPFILFYILREFFIQKINPHPNNRRYLKMIFKRLESSCHKFTMKEIAILDLTKNKFEISKNKIKWKPQASKFFGWNFIQNEGHGWKIEEDYAPKYNKYSLATSFGPCELDYNIKLSDFGEEFLEKFKLGEYIITAGCWIAKRWKCPAQGGCDLILSSESKEIFRIRCEKNSKDIPNVDYEHKKYACIMHTLSFDDIDVELNGDVILTLKIYGSSNYIWSGWFGPKFFGMFIRGNFSHVS